MSKIRDNEHSMNKAILEFDDQAKELKKLQGELEEIRTHKTISGKVYESLAKDISDLARILELENAKVNRLGVALEEIQRCYHDCENRLSGNTSEYNITRKEGTGSDAKASKEDKKKSKSTARDRKILGWTSEDIKGDSEIGKSFSAWIAKDSKDFGTDNEKKKVGGTVGGAVGLFQASATASYGIKVGRESKINIFKKSDDKYRKYEHFRSDDLDNSGKWKSDDSNVYALEGGGEVAVSVTALEGHAEAEATSKRLNVGIGGEVKAEIGKAEASLSVGAHIGNDRQEIGVAGNVMVSAVKGKAKGKINARWFQVDFGVEGHAGAVGADFAAGFGYDSDTGKVQFKWDFGVAALLGFKASTTVSLNVKQIGSDIKDAAVATYEGVKTAGKAVGKAVSTAAKAIKNFFNSWF